MVGFLNAVVGGVTGFLTGGPIGAFIGGMGGLMEDRAAKKEQQRYDAAMNPRALGADYQKMRDDAQKAGFNPLTALYAGGTGAYTRQYGPYISPGTGGTGGMAALDAFGGLMARQFDQQMQRDRLALDTDYLALEKQKFGHSVEMDRSHLARLQASPFGPVAQMDLGPPGRYEYRGKGMADGLTEDYGYIAGNLGGLVLMAEDGVRDVVSWGRAAMGSVRDSVLRASQSKKIDLKSVQGSATEWEALSNMR